VLEKEWEDVAGLTPFSYGHPKTGKR